MGVSVVIPSYNSAPWLRETITSALNQTVGPADVIVVDDGSTDETLQICGDFSSQIRVQVQLNQGVAAARNHGASLASGEWLLFLDSDDRLMPHALERLEAAADPQAGVVYGWCLMRGEKLEDAKLHGDPRSAGPPPSATRVNFRRSMITTPGVAIIRRQLHEDVGGFVSGYEPMEDRDFWMKCGMLATFRFCDTVVLDKTWRPGSAGTQIGKRISSALKSQLAFLDWCKKRNLDASFLDLTPADLVNQAFKDILWYRRWEALPNVRQIADQLNVQGYWYHRANFQRRLAGWIGGES